MHTFNHGNRWYHYSSDFSGDVVINDDKDQQIAVPFEDIKHLAYLYVTYRLGRLLDEDD